MNDSISVHTFLTVVAKGLIAVITRPSVIPVCPLDAAGTKRYARRNPRSAHGPLYQPPIARLGSAPSAAESNTPGYSLRGNPPSRI